MWVALPASHPSLDNSIASPTVRLTSHRARGAVLASSAQWAVSPVIVTCGDTEACHSA